MKISTATETKTASVPIRVPDQYPAKIGTRKKRNTKPFLSGHVTMTSAETAVSSKIPNRPKQVFHDGHAGRRTHSRRIMNTGPAMITPRASAKNHVKRISSATLSRTAYDQIRTLAAVKADNSATVTAATESARPSRKTPSHGQELQIRR